MRQTLLVGGSSAIGEQIARNLASAKGVLYLTARGAVRLDTISADLVIRGAAEVKAEPVDFTDAKNLVGLVSRAADSLGGLDAVIIVAGQLPDQDEVNRDSQRLRETMEVNATSAMVLLNEAAAFFEQQGHGQIVAIGSVAGDRGRATNYAYGAAKGALEIFLSGLRQRLHKRGVQVLLVKPGFVDTPMTAAFKKGPLWASPERVARDIVRAMDKGKSVIYTPWWWRWIMLVIRLIPEALFVRLRF
jgi:short-subunit dehydrogenase